MAIDRYIAEKTGKPQCDWIPMKGTETRSEYEPENVSWREQCSICGQIRFCSQRRPVPKTELVIDNT